MSTRQLLSSINKPVLFEEEFSSVVYAILIMIETRDPYTAQHQRRVASLAAAIAKDMGLPESDVINIRYTCLLHDIGKLAVPIEILTKPSRLSQYEFSLIQSHSEAGYDMLVRVGFPDRITDTVLQHHERLDGSGYPRQLLAQDITLEAKILAIADVVEAMASHRPYRPALGLDCALKEINQKKGILYDVEIVETCTTLFWNNEPEFLRLMELAENNRNSYSGIASSQMK